MTEKNMVAFDCGNSSFRTILGRYDGKKLVTEVVDQVPNYMIEVNGYFYWDILYIYKGLIDGLKKTTAMVKKIDSIGICTWGVDFALFSKEGVMLNNPCSYRNPYGSEIFNEISADDKRSIFYETGILCDKINSLFLLNALNKKMPTITDSANTLLMIPDILNYFFTGCMINEPSEFSTTQLMNVKTKKVSKKICDMFSIRHNLFAPIGTHGTVLGNLKSEIKKEIGIEYDIPVICVPSHDTAAAVMAVPATGNDAFMFISAGTWSLIGTELAEPLISDDVLTAGLTNEVGAFDSITLLKNSAGMFILQRLKKEYETELGREIEWKEVDLLTAAYKGTIPIILVNDVRFFNPASMSETIWKYLLQTRQVTGNKSWAMLFRCVEKSLACSYALTLAEIEKICKNNFNSVYIVGGGSRNKTIDQLTANYTGKEVLTGAKESTSLGNLLTQIKYFYPELSRKDLRNIVAKNMQSIRYTAQNPDKSDLAVYQKLASGGMN
ncbi:rhamnulokinase [Treponema parvum]|uniref:Rhamnulokinase n=1 Tax=Treponema parvum TaxID=138851 RepID=A0A975F3K4_9SPIR|nr:rhamnulokinase family protein [Treponema parvum]QTQ13984.1 rhamnulokinase [Treponema parvum]